MTDRTVVVRLQAKVGDFVAGMGTARAAVRGVTSEIDTTNDRVAWLSQSILAIGPALIPLGAAAVPVLSGIATEAGAAAAAVGVMALAFIGVGDAMKAVNDYQAKPTIENFDKMQQVLQKLGPDGAEFVAFIDDITPRLHSLQLIARAGIFPGAEEGISSLLTMMPRVKGLVSDIASAIGELMSEAGKGISGDGLKAFFDFLDTDARDILLDLGRTIGNFGSGFLNMLAAFAPLSNQFSDGLLEMSRTFNQWSKGLDQDTGFQNFIAYVQESIPKALDFLASLSQAFVAILEAAAPVGDVMLPVLSDLLQIIAAIAQTPLGPIFFTAAAMMSLYGRAVALASVTTGGLIKGLWEANTATAEQVRNVSLLPAVMREAAAAQTALIVAEAEYAAARTTYVAQLQAQNRMIAEGYAFVADAGSASAARLADSLTKVELAQSNLTAANTRATNAEKERGRITRGTAVAAGKAAGAVAGLAVITSSYGQNMSASNTVTLALMGAMVGGPFAGPAAAAGGLVGATMDLHAATGKAADSQKQLRQEIKAAGTDMTAYSDAVQGAQDRADAWYDDVNSKNIGEALANAFDPDVIAAFTEEAFGGETQGDKLDKQAAAAKEDLRDLMLAAQLMGESMGVATNESATGLEQMTDVLNQAQPAMAALGFSTQDLIDAARTGSLGVMIDALKTWQTNADSTAGRTDAVVDAVKGLDNQLRGTADNATALAQALDALFSPKLSLSAARDAWTEGLKSLDKELAKGSKSLEGNSKAALQNRDVIRDRVGRILDTLKAEADAGASAKQLTHTLGSQRDALIKAGDAANMSKGELRKYLHELGLTPGLVNTLIQNNAPGAKRDVDALNNALNNLDGKVVKTIIKVVKEGGALLDDAFAAVPGFHSAGGLVTGPGGPRDDRINARLSNREYVVQAAAVAKYGVGLFEKYNAMRFADGGFVGNTYTRTRGDDAPPGAHDGHNAASALNAVFIAGNLANWSLKRLKTALDEATKTVDKDKAARDAVLDKMTQLGGTVAGGIRSDIFAAPSNPWSAAATGGPNSVLDADIARANETAQLIKTLEGKGLTGGALAEVLSKQDIGLLRAYAAMSNDVLAAYSAKYDQREKALQAVSSAAGTAAYGGELSAAQSELRQANRELHEIKLAIKVLDKENRKGHKATASSSAAGGGAGAAARARRRARRP